MQYIKESRSPEENARLEEFRRRVGRFTVSRRMVENDPVLWATLLRGMCVVRTEAIYWGDRFEYVALSDQFDVTPLGQVVPDYTAIITEHKLDDGRTTYDIVFEREGARQ